MNTKNVILITVGIIVALGIAFFAIINFVVMPVSTIYNTTLADNSSLLKKVKTLESDLDNVKTVVRDDINKKMKGLLVKYIQDNTNNLTDSMVTDAAEAITTAAWKHKLPLSLVVGVAQATTGFNTTHASKDGSRGILGTDYATLSKMTKKPAVFYNTASNGAEFGAKVLSKLVYDNEKMPVLFALDAYLDKRTPDDLNTAVLACAANYDLYSFKAYKQYEDNIGVKPENVAGVGG